MKKLLVLAAFAVFGLSTVNAQDVAAKMKSGGFKVGANVGFSLLNSNRYFFYVNEADDFGSFNFGVDFAYLFEVIPNLEVGGLVGYTQYVASGGYDYINDNGDQVRFDYKDAGFVPISSTARYYFADKKFFGGVDLGYAINVIGDDNVNGGFYLRPKFGFNLGNIALIASYQRIFGNTDYRTNGNTYYSLSGFASFNVGAEFSF